MAMATVCFYFGVVAVVVVGLCSKQAYYFPLFSFFLFLSFFFRAFCLLFSSHSEAGFGEAGCEDSIHFDLND